MKRRLLDWHLYVGLVCAPYVVVYGLSAIFFNHGWMGGSRESDREVPLALTLPSDDRAAAETVREALGVVGWIAEFKLERHGPDRIVVPLARPGAEITVDADTSAGVARIHERRRGLVAIVRGLHGLKDLADTAWGRSWGVYTELSAWGLVFSVVTGAWLCLPRRAARVAGGAFLALGTVAAMALAAGVW